MIVFIINSLLDIYIFSIESNGHENVSIVKRADFYSIYLVSDDSFVGLVSSEPAGKQPNVFNYLS